MPPNKRIPLTTITLANDNPSKKIPTGTPLIPPNHRQFNVKESTIHMNRTRQRKLSAEIQQEPLSPELEGDKLILIAQEKIRQNSIARIRNQNPPADVTTYYQSVLDKTQNLQPSIQPPLRAERQSSFEEERRIKSMIGVTNRNQNISSTYSKPKDAEVTTKATVKQYWNPLKSRHETEAIEVPFDPSDPPRYKEKSAVNKMKKVNHDQRRKDQSHQFHETLVEEENLAAAWGKALGKRRKKSSEKPIQEKKTEPVKQPVKQPDVSTVDTCKTKSLPVEEPTADTCDSAEEISQDSLSPERLKRSTSSVVRTANKRKLAAPNWSPIKAQKSARKEPVTPAQNHPAQKVINFRIHLLYLVSASYRSARSSSVPSSSQRVPYHETAERNRDKQYPSRRCSYKVP